MKKSIWKVIIVGICLGLLVTCSLRNDDEDSTDGSTLYERLGGEEAIAAVVKDMTARVAADDRINQFFAKTNIPKFERLLAEHLCLLTGGGCRYTGRDMFTLHQGMGITEDDFNALVENLVATLDSFQVPEAEKAELLQILGGLKTNIVQK